MHGTLLFPPTPTDPVFLGSFAGHLFAPLLDGGPSVERSLDALVARFADELSLGGLVGRAELSSQGRDEAAMRRDLRAEVDRARVCLEAMVDACADVDVVGLSVAFESQLPAALALAGRLKRSRPGVPVVLGGAACTGDPGVALLEGCSWLDAVCLGEGEGVIVPLVEALLAGDPSGVAGVAWRGEGGVVANPANALNRDLDALPLPDYSGFLAALRASPWAGSPKLYFELSRGCWWGERHLCSFCGLNGEGLAFRRKSGPRARAEVEALSRAAPEVRRLQATDNILDPRAIGEVFEPLAGWGGPPIFLEVRASLSMEQLRVLARAGVDVVQPGIEALHDGILAGMDKGAGALAQVAFLRRSVEVGIFPAYNLLIDNPGDRAAWYEQMLALVDALDHLPPPVNITPVQIERFSPLQSDPSGHGLRGLRPKPWYDVLLPGLDAGRVGYVFDAEWDREPGLAQAMAAFALRVGRWQADWRPGQVGLVGEGQRLRHLDLRRGVDEVLAPELSLALRALDRVRAPAGLARELGADAQELLAELVERGLVVRDERGRAVCVVPLVPSSR